MAKEFSGQVSIAFIPHPWSREVFCVDGRKGKRRSFQGEELSRPYVQLLGGSLNSVVARGILEGKEPLLRGNDFLEVAKETFRLLREKGFSLGLHSGHHASEEKGTSDCGFADNLPKILFYLREESKGRIWNTLLEKRLVSEKEEEIFEEIIFRLRKVNLESLPSGREIIESLRDEEGVAFQILDGEHKEAAALINFQRGETVDVDKQNPPLFNLDIWRIEEEAASLGLNVRKTQILTLGLYLATEIALVEDKGEEPLPLIIKRR